MEFVDIYPTLVDLANVAAPARLDGRSLRPLIEDPLSAWQGSAVTQVLRPADDRLSRQVMGRSIRTDRWRYTEWDEGQQGVELYDHHADPLEFHNLAINPDPLADQTMDRLRRELQTKASGKAPSTPVNPARL